MSYNKNSSSSETTHNELSYQYEQIQTKQPLNTSFQPFLQCQYQAQPSAPSTDNNTVNEGYIYYQSSLQNQVSSLEKEVKELYQDIDIVYDKLCKKLFTMKEEISIKMEQNMKEHVYKEITWVINDTKTKIKSFETNLLNWFDKCLMQQHSAYYESCQKEISSIFNENINLRQEMQRFHKIIGLLCKQQNQMKKEFNDFKYQGQVQAKVLVDSSSQIDNKNDKISLKNNRDNAIETYAQVVKSLNKKTRLSEDQPQKKTTTSEMSTNYTLISKLLQDFYNLPKGVSWSQLRAPKPNGSILLRSYAQKRNWFLPTEGIIKNRHGTFVKDDFVEILKNTLKTSYPKLFISTGEEFFI